MHPSWQQWTATGSHLNLLSRNIFTRQDGPTNGHPVTLIHGYPTSSHDWAPIVPALIDTGHRVTTLDLLGFGASDKPQRHQYRLTEQADLVEALWQHLDIPSTALVAHDYGVSVAQELLARDATRITRTAWLNGGLYPDLHRPLTIQRLLHGPLGGLLSRLSSETTFRASMHKILGRPVSDDDLHDMWLALSNAGGRKVQHQLLGYLDERQANAERWTQALENYPGPMLFIWGPADPVSGAHVLPRLRERMPHAQFVVLDEEPVTGHYPQLEQPDAVANALTKFL